jgi:hypothetical protein
MKLKITIHEIENHDERHGGRSHAGRRRSAG